MPLIWREPPAWPLYVDAAGHQWKLAPNGYWWLYLHATNFWYQAGSQAAGDVLGIPVPVNNPAAFTAVMGEMTERLSKSPGWANLILPARSADPRKKIRAKPGEPKPSSPVPAPVKVAPNTPPDFLPVLLAEGCCTGCHLDDGPLFEGKLCRYCWMLASADEILPAAHDVVELTPAQPLRQSVLASAAIVSLLLALWLALRLILLIAGHV